jgi:hypothetical protein
MKVLYGNCVLKKNYISISPMRNQGSLISDGGYITKEYGFGTGLV